MVTFKPIITEKSLQEQTLGKYHFLVNVAASKHQIKEAFANIFGAKALAVNTSITKGRTKSDWKRRQTIPQGKLKKAIVTVAANAKINLLATETKKSK